MIQPTKTVRNLLVVLALLLATGSCRHGKSGERVANSVQMTDSMWKDSATKYMQSIMHYYYNNEKDSFCQAVEYFPASLFMAQATRLFTTLAKQGMMPAEPNDDLTMLCLQIKSR